MLLFPNLAYVVVALVLLAGLISILLFLRRRRKIISTRPHIEEMYLLPFTDENDHSAVNKLYMELEECQDESNDLTEC